MPGCCGSGASCSCKVSAGSGVTVSGSGTAVDPFVISASVHFTVTDNAQFDLTLTGSGAVGDEYNLAVTYKSTARLQDIPNVNAPAPTNGQVLAWNTATSQWVAQAPTTAPTGAVTHDTSLSGDGSVGNPLGAAPIAARFLATFAAGGLGAGLGMNDLGINQLVRHFTDSGARDLANPAPVLNTLAMLDTDPGRIQFWDGTQWSPLGGASDTQYIGGTEFLALSGSYLGSRRTHLIKQFSGTTDASGLMDVLTPADLLGRGGVLSVQFQETGPAGVAFKAVLFANTDRVSAYVYRISDGSLYTSFAFTGIIEAWLY